MGILSFVLLIAAIVECSIVLQKKIEEIIPVALCVLILTLQILGMFQCLSMIATVLAFWVILFGCFILRGLKTNGGISAIKQRVQKDVCTFGLLVIAEIILLCMVFEWGRLVSTYDEFNFWGTAVKSLWHYNGFADAGEMWAIWEYPQGMPLFQWFGIFIKGCFSDDILYMMRLIFDFTFIAAFLRKIKLKWYFSPLVSILIILFPSVVNATSYVTLSVDGDLAILFGYTLCCIWDRAKTNWFYYFRIAVLLCTIILTKSLSVLWVGYLLLFLFGWEALELRMEGQGLKGKTTLRKLGYLGLCTLAPCITLKTWSFFLAAAGSLPLHASARASSAVSDILTGKWVWSGYEKELILSFLKALFARPASYVSGGRNNFITPFLLVTIIVLIIRYAAKKQAFSKWKKNLLYVYLGMVWGSYFLVFVLTMCTVFVGEIRKYSRINAMALACGRYCAPLFLGFALFALFLLIETAAENTMPLEKKQKKKLCIWGSIFIILCCNTSALSASCSVLPSNKQTAEKALKYRESKTYEVFPWVDRLEGLAGKKKVLWISSQTLDMAYVYILYPVMIHKYDSGKVFASIGEFQDYLTALGCEYIYYDSGMEDSHITDMLLMMLEENGQEKMEGLYKIDMSHVGFQLQRIP